MRKVVRKFYKKSYLKLICLINELEEIKNATWLRNTYITNTKETFSLLSTKALYVILRFFWWLRITIIALVLQLIWHYNTSRVSNIGDLKLVLIFWFRIIKSGWFYMMEIIASNFLNIGNGWAIVEEYATNVVCVGTNFSPIPRKL